MKHEELVRDLKIPYLPFVASLKPPRAFNAAYSPTEEPRREMLEHEAREYVKYLKRTLDEFFDKKARVK